MDIEETTEEAGPQPKAARVYLDMIEEARTAFRTYDEKCTSIEKKYASLKTMSEAAGDREFQLFWANLEVLKPTIYSRPPVPVVMPRNKDSNSVNRKASEMLERALAIDVEQDDLHETLCEIRDDLAIAGRGVAWVLDSGECLHVDRKDFLHEPARKWKEVGWVARQAYMTREAIEERFPEADVTRIKFDHVGAKDEGRGEDYKGIKKACVWEMWHKAEQAVCWVTEGHDDVLDYQPPLMNVKGFFPCPRPAYSTLERATLKPVPDYVYYRDQLDEIDELTARMASLSESLRLKGFYASGSSEIGEAIEAAMRQTDNKAILIPISNFAAIGGAALKDAIVWLPVQVVAEVITSLVALRRQLIEDVYEITGLSDIMRGSTEASETATAQNLKAQYGSVRVRERQGEMVRVARDVLRLKAEVYAELMPIQELAAMAQSDIPDMATVQMQAQQQMMQAQQSGQPAQPPDMSKVVTLEQIDELLKHDKMRPFILEVESDSTIAPNEEAEKASRIEFITAMGSFIQQAGGMVQAQPETAPFAAEMMKFAAGAFRSGRELGAAIDEFADQIKNKAAQPQEQQPDPMVMKAQADAQMAQAKMQMDQQKMQMDAQKAQTDAELTVQKMQAEMQMAAQAHQQQMRLIDAQIQKIMAEIQRIGAQATQVSNGPPANR